MNRVKVFIFFISISFIRTVPFNSKLIIKYRLVHLTKLLLLTRVLGQVCQQTESRKKGGIPKGLTKKGLVEKLLKIQGEMMVKSTDGGQLEKY